MKQDNQSGRFFSPASFLRNEVKIETNGTKEPASGHRAEKNVLFKHIVSNQVLRSLLLLAAVQLYNQHFGVATTFHILFCRLAQNHDGLLELLSALTQL